MPGGIGRLGSSDDKSLLGDLATSHRRLLAVSSVIRNHCFGAGDRPRLERAIVIWRKRAEAFSAARRTRRRIYQCRLPSARESRESINVETSSEEDQFDLLMRFSQPCVNKSIARSDRGSNLSTCKITSVIR